VHAPKTVHVNEPYRVRATGTASRKLSLMVFVRPGTKKCRKTPPDEIAANSYPAIRPDGPPPSVGPGDFKKRSDQLADPVANGHDRVCGYLFYSKHGEGVVVARDGLKIASKE
jgi:hypothetical protein